MKPYLSKNYNKNMCLLLITYIIIRNFDCISTKFTFMLQKNFQTKCVFKIYKDGSIKYTKYTITINII